MTQGIQGMTSQGEAEIQFAKPVADDSEPYRRLIELQKQMIELVRQHEKTKGECAALRTQMLDEMAGPQRPWRRWRLSLGRLSGSRRKGFVPAWKALVKGGSQSTDPSLRTFPFRNPTSP
jgi:hypothetical protein